MPNLLGQYRTVSSEFWQGKLSDSKIHGSKIDVHQLYDQITQHSAPVFVLSTGRTGTKLISNLLAINKTLKVYHRPHPELEPFSRFAFAHGSQEEVQRQFLGARYEVIRNTHLLGKVYVETNNRISFYCAAINALFPASRFIHLVRDPLTFIQSAWSRNWLSGNSIHDEGRFLKEEWDQIPQLERIVRFWLETNLMIHNFTSSIDQFRVLNLSSDQLYNDLEKLTEVHQFIDPNFQAPVNTLKNLQSKKVNAQPAHRKKSLSPDQISFIHEVLSQYQYPENWNR